MLMHFCGGGVGHTSTRTATNQFLQDRDWLDRDNGPTQGGDEPDASEDDFDSNDVDEAMDKEGDGDNDLESKHIQGSQSGGSDDDDISLRGGSGGHDGEGLGGDNEEPETGDVNDKGRNDNEEEDYGYM